MASWALPPALLEPYVPKGTRLDLFEGSAWASLVAFGFRDVRVKGLRIPGHTDFVEVNLRFYVVRDTPEGPRRGATFVSEIVPRRAIALVANGLYGERYSVWRTSVEGTTYRWSRRDERYAFGAELGAELPAPDPASLPGFVVEHYWGYTRRGEARTDEYRVAHPRWTLREVRSHAIEADFARLYGPEFAPLNARPPDDVLWAVGSEVAVYSGGRIAL